MIEWCYGVNELSSPGNLNRRPHTNPFADPGRGLGKTEIDSQTTLQYVLHGL